MSPSDPLRVPVALAAGVGALALMAWWIRGLDHGEIGALQVLREPDGSEVVLSLLRVESIDGPDRYFVGHSTLHVPITGSTAGRVVGEEVTIGGIVEDGRVRARWVEAAPDRPAKHALGIAGIAIGLALMGGATRRVPGGLALRG